MRGALGADIGAFEAAVGAAPRGAGGILTLPFFNGERTPDLPRAKACLVGLDSRNTGRENLLRSALEGATFALRYGVDRLGALGIEPAEVLLTGGGAGSATWRQVVADVCGAPVTVWRQDEGAGFGAALQALAALEGEDDIQALADAHLDRNEALCCEPDGEAVDFYQAAYGRYLAAVEAVTPLYH
jgi:xylulokinase